MKFVLALIDTGATMSTISPNIADELGLPVIDDVTCGLADGSTVRAEKVLAMLALPKQTGGGEVRFLELAKVDASSVDMLFGMDALAGGTLVVATRMGRWHWRMNKNTTEWLEIYPPTAAVDPSLVVAEEAVTPDERGEATSTRELPPPAPRPPHSN